MVLDSNDISEEKQPVTCETRIAFDLASCILREMTRETMFVACCSA